MKKPSLTRLIAALSLACCAGSLAAAGFNSGSTGADGAFAPTADTTVQLPASGVLNYTTVNIPTGVTVTFTQSNKAPVVMLASGDVKIAGTIDISGASTPNVTIGSFQFQGGKGGPGGYDGGWGGQPVQVSGGTGFGPGGGGGGTQSGSTCNSDSQGGGGGGFTGNGEASYCVRNGGYLANVRTGFGGPGYGSITMLPLIGGSGGGGGAGSISGLGAPGSGGGGGGGALLLVSSGSVELTGSVQAKGGNSGYNYGTNCNGATEYGGTGGGGSGGAVRIIASAFTGNGTINVAGGTAACANNWFQGGNGAPGRSSVEIVTGGTFNLSALPSLAFTSIGGVAVPPNPVGAGDVVLPNTVTNPVTVNLAASGIPVGTVVKVILNQPYGANITADSSPLSGTLQSSTASASIDIPPGATVLMASTTYTLTLAMGDALSVYAQGERVEKVRLTATMGGQTQATLITVSGKEFNVPYAVLATIPG